MKNALILSLALIACLSCSRPLELMAPSDSLTKIAFVYQPTSDFYSALAVPENQVGNGIAQPAPKWGEGHISLFSNSPETITYLINGKATHSKVAVKAVMQKHSILDIKVNENDIKTQKTFIINYTE